MAEITSMTLGGRYCVVPKTTQYNLGYLCPLGPTPGYGACLMTWSELSQLNPNTYQTLTMVGGSAVAIPNLIIVKTTKVNRSPVGHPGGLHLVELADKRYLLERFSDTNRQFNVWNPRQRATDHEDPACYYPETLNGSVLWTWQAMIQRLWNDCNLLGTFSLSLSLNDKPKNFHFIGANAWKALHEVLEFVGLTTAYDPVASTFSIVSMGQTQTGLSAVVSAAASRYYGSADPINSNLARYPAALRVYFPRKDLHYGTEPDDSQSGNWIIDSVRTFDAATGISGAQAGTTKQLWSNQPSLRDFSGAETNGTEIAQVVIRRVADWKNDRLYSETRARTVYSGIVPLFRCGSEVKSVHWRYLGDAEHGGYLTEISRHPGIPESLHTPAQDDWSESYREYGPDFARHSTPHYPEKIQIVKILVQQSNYATWSGEIQRMDPAIAAGVGPQFQSLDSCFVQFINDEAYRVVPTEVPETTINYTRVYKPHAGDRYLARANGITTSVGDVTLPLYTARLDHPQTVWYGVLYEDMDAGDYDDPSGPYRARLIVPQASGAWLDTGIILTRLFNTQGAFVSGTRVQLHFDLEANLFHVLGAASAGTVIRVAKLRESLYPCSDPASPEGPVTADIYDCETDGEGVPTFTATGDTVELWNALQNYYQKDTFVRYDHNPSCGVALVTEGYHPGVFQGVLGSPLAAGGTSDATLLSGEPDVDVSDPFLHPIDGGLAVGLVYDASDDSWFPVQAEMSTFDVVCDIDCSPSLSVSYTTLRVDYTVEACPPAAAPLLSSVAGSAPQALNVDMLSVQFPPEILTDYVDVSVLAAVYTTAMPFYSGHNFGSAGSPGGPTGPIG